jgi:hypothetical protein
MTSKDAQQAQDVVLGMFLASSHPATILFDSGASHSFILSSFVAKHSLPIATMKHTMLVSSPGGEMRTKHICPAVSITIRGVDFLSNAIVIPRSEKVGTKPPYVCPGCSNHTYSNNMITRFHVQ